MITFSALAAGASAGACDDDADNVSVNPPPPWNAQGGFAGSAGGAGGAGGTSGVGGESPEVVMPQCPAEAPMQGEPCNLQQAPARCSYDEDESEDPCEDPDWTLATCEQGAWSIEIVVTTCNPPQPDEDAGTE